MIGVKDHCRSVEVKNIADGKKNNERGDWHINKSNYFLSS